MVIGLLHETGEFTFESGVEKVFGSPIRLLDELRLFFYCS